MDAGLLNTSMIKWICKQIAQDGKLKLQGRLQPMARCSVSTESY